MKRKLILLLSSILGIILAFNLIVLIIMWSSNSSFTVSKITLESLSDERQYDGTELMCQDVKITSGNLYKGDYIKAEYDGSQLGVGEARNLFEAKIYNKSGMDVSNEYDISYVYGSLKVVKRDITVKLIDEEIPYDAKEAFLDQYEITEGSLVGDDHIEIETSEGLTTIGSKRITFTAHVLDGEGNDVSNNYNITSVDGTITRTAVDLTIKSKGAEVTYDGNPLTCEEYEIVDGSLMAGDRLDITYGASITDVGTVNNEFSVRILNTASDGVVTDVTTNYNITKQYGVLAIDPIELEFTSGDHAKVYDGTVLSITEEDISYTGALPSFASIGIEPTKEITNVGSVSNEFNVYIFKVDENGDYLLDEEGNKIDITSNFAIEKNFGILTINKVDLNIETGSLEKYYDGTETTIEKYTILNPNALVGGNTVNVTAATSKTDVGTYDNLMNVSVLSADGKNVTFNYNLQLTYGKLIIDPITIKIQTGSATKNFDNKPLTCYDYYVISGELIAGQYMEYTNNTSITEIGQVRNYGVVTIYDSLGEKINSKNYDIVYSYGVLRVVEAKNIVYLQPKDIIEEYVSDEKVYKPEEVVGFDNYANQGYRIEAIFEGEQIGAGTTATSITSYTIYNEFGRDVTDDFVVEVYPGIILVYLYDVTITTASAEKIYDGTALTADSDSDITIEADTGIEVNLEITGSQTVVGSSQNRVVVKSIAYNGSYVDIDKVRITYNFGNLTVTKKEITLITGSKTFDYDENVKYYSYETFEENTDYSWLKANNYSVEIVEYTTLTGKGISENNFVVKIYDSELNDVTLSFVITYEYGTIKVV